MPDNISDKVIAVIAQQAILDPNEVSLDRTLDDLGIDSLGMVECIFAIEEGFDISVPFNANEPVKSDFDTTTVSSMIDAVKTLIKDQKT